MAHRSPLRSSTYNPWPKNKSKFAHKSRGRKPKTIALPDVGDLSSPTLQVSSTAIGGKPDENTTKGLEAAARVILESVKNVAAPISERTAASLEVRKLSSGRVQIRGGGPSAPMASQFEVKGSRHPVYAKGPRRDWHWGVQPYREYLERGAEIAGDDAAEAFADATIDVWADEIGDDRP